MTILQLGMVKNGESCHVDSSMRIKFSHRFFYSQSSVNLTTFSILDQIQWENGHNILQQSGITIESQPFPPKKFDLSVLSIWIGYRINWIISEVQGNKFFFFIFLASKKLLAPLRSRIGTCSVFCHSFSVSPGVRAKFENMFQF